MLGKIKFNFEFNFQIKFNLEFNSQTIPRIDGRISVPFEPIGPLYFTHILLHLHVSTDTPSLIALLSDDLSSLVGSASGDPRLMSF